MTTEATSPGQKRFRLYTRTGDNGTSCLYTGQRLHKDNLFFEALGDVDELNSWLGLAREHVEPKNAKLADQLATIQSRLIDVGAALATPANAVQGAKVGRTRFDAEHTTTLEGWLDAMDDELPALTQFILPSGGQAAATLHLARTVARRAERSAIALSRFYEQTATQPCDSKPAQGVVGPTEALVSVSTSSDQGTTTAAMEDSLNSNPQPESQCETADSGSQVVDPAARVYLNRLSDYLFTAARYMAKLEGRREVTYRKPA